MRSESLKDTTNYIYNNSQKTELLIRDIDVMHLMNYVDDDIDSKTEEDINRIVKRVHKLYFHGYD